MNASVSPTLRALQRRDWWIQQLKDTGAMAAVKGDDVQILREFEALWAETKDPATRALMANYLTGSLVDAVTFLLRMNNQAPGEAE